MFDPDVRTAAVLSCDRSRQRVSLASVWAELVGGELQIVDEFSYGRRRYAVLKSRGQSSSPLSEHGVALLCRALQGQMQKSIAVDLGSPASTVASNLAQCLHAMGLRCSVTRVPPLLVMLYHAHRSGADRMARSAMLQTGDTPYRIIAVDRPDEKLPSGLTEAERAVVQLALEGRTNREIAAVRRTSAHTIAKQVASAFRKLNVDCRAELLWHLVSNRTEPLQSGSPRRHE